MEADSYPSSQEIHSICLDNVNKSYKIKEDLDISNCKNIETIKVEYMTYSNYNELPQNSSTLNVVSNEISNLDIFNTENNFSKSIKGSLITSYNRPIDTGTSRRRQTFKCPYCPKVFCNSSAIAKHKLTHSDERKYVCDTCGKAFKRQDHLNGHKHTHKVNKPHACHFCERSYSDARSLKRHYENQHQKEYKEKMAARDSGSSVDDNGSSVIEVFGYFEDHKSVKCEVCGRGFKNQAALNGHMRLHGGYGQTKNTIAGPGEPKINIPFIENATEKISESISGDKKLTSLTKAHSNIIIVTTRPESNSERQIQTLRTIIPSSVNTTSNFSNHCNSSSVIVLNSHHFTNSPKYNQSLSPATRNLMDSNNLPNVSIEDLCLVLPPTTVQDSARDPCNISSISEKSSSPVEMSTDGIGYSQSTTKKPSLNTPSQYSPITPAYTNKNGNINLNEPNLFTYPALLDSVQISNQTFNDSNLPFDNHQSDDYLMNFEKYPPGFVSSNSNSITKSWGFNDLSLYSGVTPEYNNSNPPSLKKISSNNNLQDLLMNLDNLSDSNDITNNSVHSTIEDQIWPQYPDSHILNDSFGKTVKKEETSLTTMDRLDCPPLTINDDNDNNLVLKPLISEAQPVPQISHRKNKCRPAPIFIPPQTSAHMSRLRSPRVWNNLESSEQKIPPYTPPPMLSPQRRGSGLFNTLWQSSVKNSANSFYSWHTPCSAKAITAVSNSYHVDSVVSSLGDHQISTVCVQDYSNGTFRSSFEKTNEPEHFIYQDDFIDVKPLSVDDKDGLPTSATPRINIGVEYQADVPTFYIGKRHKYSKRIYDTLCWNPRHFKETTENISSLNLLMKIASSPAVKSCGLNMEYTFHLLFRNQGDLEKTLQTLLEDSFVVYDYVYAETSNWTTEEIGKFQERLKAHDRDFMRVSLDLQQCGMNKSVKACVEFYYVWKHMNNVKYVNTYRVKQRRRLATRNSTPQHEYDNYPTAIDLHSSTITSVESQYNLRRKYTAENQKISKPFSYYSSKASSDSSSREHSPSTKLHKSITVLTQDNTAKKSRLSYQCSQCHKIFAKLNTLDNHNRKVHSKLSRNKTQNRNIERASESTRY